MEEEGRVVPDAWKKIIEEHSKKTDIQLSWHETEYLELFVMLSEFRKTKYLTYKKDDGIRIYAIPEPLDMNVLMKHYALCATMLNYRQYISVMTYIDNQYLTYMRKRNEDQ